MLLFVWKRDQTLVFGEFAQRTQLALESVDVGDDAVRIGMGVGEIFDKVAEFV